MGQDIFDTADEDQVGEALDVGANVADGSRDADFRVAIQGRGGGHRRRRNKNQPKIQIIFLKKPRFLRDPRHRLRHDLRRMQADKSIDREHTLRVESRKSDDQRYGCEPG